MSLERVRIPAEVLPGMVGRRVHLSWASPGCQWVLLGVSEDGKRVELETPTTYRRRTAHAADVQFTKKGLAYYRRFGR